MDSEKLKKQFTHYQTELCRICEKKINTNSDDWTVIIEYEGKDQTSKGFYHRKCLKDLIKGKVELIQQQFKEKLIKLTRGMIGNIRNPA